MAYRLIPRLFLVRILVNFMQRGEVWFVHALADDAKTPITPIQEVRELGTLVLRAVFPSVVFPT
jgi:hypothetical protein